MQVSDRAIYHYLPAFAAVGVEPERLLASCDVRFDNGEIRPESPFVYHDVMPMLETAIEVSGDPLIGLRAAWRRPAMNSVLSVLVKSAQTLEESILRMHEFLHLMVLHASVGLTTGRKLSQVRPNHDTRDRHPVTTELLVAGVAGFLRASTEGSRPLVRLSFRHAPRVDPRQYETELGVPVTFEATFDGLELETRALSRRMPGSNPELVHALYPAVAQDSARARTGNTRALRARVEAAIGIRIADHELPNIDWVANYLQTSRRTLQRGLRESDLTFREIRDEALLRVTKRLLANPDRTISQVSAEIGFSQPSSFATAFRRWTGLTPLEWRRRQGREA